MFLLACLCTSHRPCHICLDKDRSKRVQAKVCESPGPCEVEGSGVCQEDGSCKYTVRFALVLCRAHFAPVDASTAWRELGHSSLLLRLLCRGCSCTRVAECMSMV